VKKSRTPLILRATTDSNGIVNLKTYFRVVTQSMRSRMERWQTFEGWSRSHKFRNRKPSATAVGIPVQIGQETRYTLNLYEEPTSLSFSIMDRDGAPHRKCAHSIRPPDRMESMSSISLDSNGLGHWTMLQSGLSEIRFVHKKDSSTGGVRSPD